MKCALYKGTASLTGRRKKAKITLTEFTYKAYFLNSDERNGIMAYTRMVVVKTDIERD